MRFSIKDLRCEKVVVYQERAEVKRLIKVNLKKGTNQLVLTNISNHIDPNSIQVQGQAQVVVLDVNTQNRRATTTTNTTGNVEPTDESSSLNESNAQLKQLQIDLKELEKLEDLANFKMERLAKTRSYLNDFAVNLSKHANLGANQVIEEEFKDISYSNNFMNFLDLYTQRAEQLDTERYLSGIELMKIRGKLDCIRLSLNEFSKQVTNPGSIEIVVLVDSKTDNNEALLHVSYMVSNVSWTPKYDIRVNSEDKTMLINYYGMVNQSTGEDWNDSKVVLSTATSSNYGQIPELETQYVRIRFREDQEKRSERRRSTKMTGSGDLMLVTLPAGQEAKQTTNELITNKIYSTSTFEIQQNASITSDDKATRVLIAEINLKPEFEYISVPRKYPNVFIKARVVNDSSYLLLAGQANVFYDNTFITRTDLSSYSPQEEFYCSLGVDSGIRIDYKPLKKFIGQTGLINKFTNVTYTQVIEVRNTTGQNAKILIQDNIPLSGDEKIQVKLIEPNIKNNPNIRLNKMNNIEFELNMPSMKTEEILIKYNVEYHSDQEIEFF